MPEKLGRAPLSRRLLVSYALIFAGVIVLFGALVESGAREVLVGDVAAGLADHAILLAAGADPAEDVTRVADVTGARVTVIGPDGLAVADSEVLPLGSLAGRPEVAAALAGRIGEDRRAEGRGGERLFVAVPNPGGGAVRLSVGDERVSEDLASVRRTVLLAAAVAGVVGLGFVWLSARRLARPLEVLTSTAAAMAAGDLSRHSEPSSIAEIDRLGQAVDRLAFDLGKRANESSRERDTLELVLAALPQGVLLVDEDDTVAYANPAAGGLLGAVSDRLATLVPHVLQGIVRQARHEAGRVEADFEHGAPVRNLRAVATALAGGDRVVVVIVDLTERQRIDAMRRDFVADASHELKTPVAAIIAASESLRLALGRDPEKVGDFAGRVEQSARQLARIVEDLLDLSRLEASEMAGEAVRLDDLVAEEAAFFGERAEEAGVELVTKLAPVTVIGSPADLVLALRNLCDNALRYTDAGGRIVVSVGESEGKAVIEVTDTGAGIPRRALPRVFERFYRVDVARARGTGGTGLGLAIVKHVAERHGGSVSAQSELGVGSTFRLVLPLPSGD